MSKKKKKGKKYTTDGSTIISYIEMDYLNDLKESESNAVIAKIPLLVTNNLACTINGYQYLDGYANYEYQTACKLMQDHNKTLKNYRRKLLDYEYGGSENRFAESDKTLMELAKYGLDSGEYFAQFDKHTFAVLIIKIDEEDKYIVHYTLHIIGKKWNKWKEKFYDEADHYKQLRKNEREEKIYFTDGKPTQTAIFKPFDQIVFKQKDSILKYIDNWKRNIPTYYDKYKMVSKLSILLYGPPGTGKSTFAKAVAHYLDIDNVTAVSPSYFESNEPSGKGGRYMRMPAGRETVNTIDDIDCVCNARDDDSSKDNNIIMANLLQYLDNPPTFFYKAENGIRYPVSIVIATTNYIDKLDPAVKRYGRFDLKIEMTEFDKEDAQQMCGIYGLDLKTLFPDSDKKGWTVSPSQLQAVCLENIDTSMKKM